MTTELFERQRAAIMAGMAAGLGCSTDDFVTDRLTIVQKPAASPWYTALAITFGVGTVMSVDPRLINWVEERAPTPPYRAFYEPVLQALANEVSPDGKPLTYYAPGICWALNEVPAEAPAPDRFGFETVDAEWMVHEMTQQRWENGLGEVNRNGREFRNRYGVVLRDADGEAAAIAGVFETFGTSEIGVDVARAHRGRGLATAIVGAAVREILGRGETPLYGCAATNIRSQRTALATGFLPVYSDGAVG